MNDRIPHPERDHVLVDVKAKPSGWPRASLDPNSGRGPRQRSGVPATGDHNYKSLRFKGIASWRSGTRCWCAIRSTMSPGSTNRSGPRPR
jgi:hypothetical protein